MPGASAVAHGAVLGIWLACAGVALGVGWLVQTHILGLPSGGRVRGFAAVWIGLAGIVLVLQVWHFVFPVNGWALAVVTAMGVTGLATTAPRPRLAIHAPGLAALLRSLLFAGLAVWLANRCLAPFVAYDSEMYMIPAVEWTKAFPLVPGLGALHGRLAFNSSSVLLAAVLDAGPWVPASSHLLNGFFLFLLAARIASRFPVSDTSGRAAVATGAFDLLLLAPLVAVALDDQLLPSLSADVGVAVAVFAGASLLFGGLAGEDPGPAADSRIAAVAAFTVALTLKLSAAVFAVFGSGVALILLFADVRAGSVRRRSVAGIAAFCLLITGTWMARGTGTSGYPFYPATPLAAPVDWRVPLEQADAEAAWVSHFARTWHSPPLANADSVTAYQWRRFHWLGPWARAVGEGRDRGLVSLPFACALVFGSGLWVLWKQGVPGRSGPGWLVLPAAAGLVFWFVAAPRPSLGFPAAWVLAALSGAMLASRLPAKAGQRSAILVGLVLPLVVAGNAVRLDYPDHPWTIEAWRWTLARDADPSDWFPEPAIPEFLQYRTRSGLTLNVPAERNLCERAPLPCTPHPAANLRLRQDGNLSGGFLIEGDWQPERWPNASSRFLGSWRASR